MLIKELSVKYNVIFGYISEAHAVDVWPIGLSAGVLNYEHKKIEDRRDCAMNFIKEYEFNIPTYLDSMDNILRDDLAAWPFRYYIISSIKEEYVFEHIGMPDDSEFDLTKITM